MCKKDEQRERRVAKSQENVQALDIIFYPGKSELEYITISPSLSISSRLSKDQIPKNVMRYPTKIYRIQIFNFKVDCKLFI